jgi:phage terminase large subunit
MSDAPARPVRVVRLQLPRKLAFLLEMHPYKVAYSGRNGLKSTSFARALLTLGIHQPLRIGCVREIQKTLAASSHQLLVDGIRALDYSGEYRITDNEIRGTVRDTQFSFFGLSDVTAENTRSLEGLDVIWADEAQRLSRRSLQILLPTLFRKPNAEFWASFNTDLDSDEVWDQFVVHPPEGAVVVEMNWRDAVACGWFPPEQERLRLRHLKYAPEDYDNIWEGKPRSSVLGAIYSREIADMMRTSRFRPIPYDPRLPVHRVWDLGWNDLMTVILVQKPHPSAINIMGYVEDAQATYAEIIQTMDGLRYRWGDDWLPHDAVQHHPTSGTNAVKQVRALRGPARGLVRVIPRSDPEARIKAARMMWPRVYMDNTKLDTPLERPEQLLGAGNLMDRLKRYKRNVPKATNEPTTPTHDAASHGADAFGAVAEIVDQIRNDGDDAPPKLPGFANPEASMGMLG